MSITASDLVAFNVALDTIERDTQTDRWFHNPVAWVNERLGEHVWSKQGQVLQAVADNPLVAVQSGHGIGKSHLASRATGWFLDTRPVGKTFVVTTAPTAPQVRAILWRYITQMWTAHGLNGRVTQAAEWKIDDQLVAYGRKPADHAESAFQGIHAEHLLVILDEACGIPKQLWVAADSLATGADSHILAIGNPDSNSSHFHRVCTSEPGWHRIKISSLDSPNVTGEPVPAELTRTLVTRDWIEDKRLRWGETSPLYTAKVLGEWADDEDGLIPLSWVKAANQRWSDWQDAGAPQPPGRTVFGVDVGHLGDDKSVIATRKGDVVVTLESWAKRDTVELVALVEVRTAEWVQPTIVPDGIGVGAGVVDQLRHRGHSVVAFMAGAGTKARDATGHIGFADVRSAAWWHLRELLDPVMGGRLALPPDDDLTADLTTPRYEIKPGAKIKVEAKDEIRKRLGRSTDYGDAVVQAMWIERYEREHDGEATALRPLDYDDANAWQDY